MYKMPENTEGKIFITAGGYVIPFGKNRLGKKEYCPGIHNKDAYKDGWLWNSDGTIDGLAYHWRKELEIVGEYIHGLTLPKGYKWKGGFPKLEEIKAGDSYLGYDNNLVEESGGPDHIVYLKTIGKKRILLEKIPTGIELKNGWWITEGGYAVQIQKSDLFFHGFINGRGCVWCKDGSLSSWTADGSDVTPIPDLNIIGECPQELIPVLPSGYEWVGGHPKFVEPKAGDKFLNILGKPEVCHGTTAIDTAEDMAHRWVVGCAGTRRILIKPIKPELPPPREEPIAKDKPLEVGKTYITKGGWLLKVFSKPAIYKNYVFLDSLTSPGVSLEGTIRTIHDVILSNGRSVKDEGWMIESKIGAQPPTVYIECETSDSLQIVGEYTGKLNPEFPNPPKGYKWKHGFPKLTTKEDGEAYYNEWAAMSNNVLSGQFSAASKGMYLTLIPDEIKPNQESVERSRALLLEIANRGLDIYNSSSKPKQQKEEEMKKETAVAVSKSVGSFAWKTINYLFLETATEIGHKIARSVRYVVFFTTVAAGAGLYFAPEKTTALVKSCLPKISISIDAPEIVR